ncbi:CRISPR-associated endonuclease Cas1 [Thiomicrospira sp. R3]|uniref:CRISPR-associated endonuclease Cas1 n=1 Tax=Thiomicrospira sp. R3 TaxID=3035472 RepID=UPI00259B5739|nr:CRISPR-associated endonuclease Cas1 [Thiomicrospira sp. R3]WFE69483.1 CRISPR-associated endonuclease Cas1 [Thiomicrospira sp. R3]
MNAFPVVIDRKDSQVSIESTTLVIRTPETTKQTIPLHLISQLIIHGKPSVESDVWRQLEQLTDFLKNHVG